MSVLDETKYIIHHWYYYTPESFNKELYMIREGLPVIVAVSIIIGMIQYLKFDMKVKESDT